ncbi:MAG: metallophosphoesterase [Deltaproteobacteria bacterium]|nr:metallophosphoesterase [Deltaproteobacteria bacterium]
MRICLLACTFLGLVFSACGGSSDRPAELPLSEQPYTTLQAVWEPIMASDETLAKIESGELTVYDHPLFSAAGFGVRLIAGNPWLELTELAPDFVAGAAEARRSLAYFWQVADPQLIDEESPIRFEAFVYLYRPNGHYSPQVFASHVATARRISERSGRPFDFALMAGDLSDGSQRNELSWALGIMEGGLVNPDSGRDDDPLPNPAEDYNDPFWSAGLGRPWYAAIGNHETLYNGGVGIISDELREAAMGTEVYFHGLMPNGFCDGSHPDAPLLLEGPTPADPDRVPLRRAEVVELIGHWPGLPEGHGLTATNLAEGTAYFSVHPLADRPLRLLVLDTANSEPEGIGEGSNGYVDEAQFAWLDQELSSAQAAGDLVILMSHHRPEDFSAESPTSGSVLRERLALSEELVLHMTGHGHSNTKRLVPSVNGLGGHWQLMLASTLDFPQQSRIFEIVWEGNGFLSIYATNLDHNAPEDCLTHKARELAAANLTLGPSTMGNNVAEYWQSDLEGQNLLLRVPIPESVQARLSEFDWSKRIESEETLLNFQGP